MTGYVAHIYDILNYDISFNFNPILEKRYESAPHKEYIYQDVEVDENYPFGPTKISKEKAYRCRVRGLLHTITNHELKTKEICKLNYTLMMTIFRLLDIENGFITCTISDIDRYGRILVDIMFPSVNVNLTQVLLMSSYGNRFLREYPKK